MFVAKLLDLEDLENYAHSPERLIQFINNEIPLWMRDIDIVVDNTFYYAALQLKTSSNVPQNVIKRAITELIKERRVCGVLGTYIPFNYAFQKCNLELLRKLIEEDKS